MIKAVLFDLDDTLFDSSIPFGKTHEHIKTKWLDRFPGVTDDYDELYKRVRSEVFERLGGTAHVGNRLLYYQGLMEKSGHSVDMKWIVKLNKDYWSYYLKNCTPADGARELLIELRAKQVKTVIVTNLYSEVQMRKLTVMGLDKYVDYFISAEEAGVAKPNEKIYRYTLNKIGLKVDEVLMVGDDIKPDILGAKVLGIKTVLIRNSWYMYTDDELKLADFVIERLSEIQNLV